MADFIRLNNYAARLENIKTACSKYYWQWFEIAFDSSMTSIDPIVSVMGKEFPLFNLSNFSYHT